MAKSFSWFIMSFLVAALTIPQVAFSQSDRGLDRRDNWWGNRQSDRRDLEGRWYLNGDRNKPAEITSSRRGVEARNERGQTSRLEIRRNGMVRALDWERGLRGEIRRGRIDWENGTTWTRYPSERRARR